MAKITREYNDTKLQPRKKTAALLPPAKSADFSRLLQRHQRVAVEQQQQQQQQQLLQLFQQTEDEARRLRRSFSQQQLLCYHRAVRAFMKLVVKDGIIVDYQQSTRRGKHKRYAILKILDRKVIELADLLLEQQNNEIVILERINQIQGLMINLLT